MKMLRPLVAVTLLVGALGRVLGSNRHHNHTAVLLGVRQPAGKVSLDSATDKLQGVLDAVTKQMNSVQNGYTKIKESCLAEVGASAKRVAAQEATMGDLETSRQLNIERTAGSEANLANLVSQETDAHQSYESSVSQRAAALQKHLSSNKATVDQGNAIGEVLEMMNKKKAMITAQQTDVKDMKVVPPTAPTSSGSGLDFVIGVLNNIVDTSKAKAEEGASKHNEDDADLERLVTSYKTSLQHIDKQYQTENARRMEAKNTARDSDEEKKLRSMLVNGEEKLDKEFVGLCGVGGKGGSVPAALDAAAFLLDTFKRQSATAIKIMDDLPDVVAGAASFLSRGAQPATEEPVVVHTSSVEVAVASSVASAQASSADVESAQDSAARWVIEQAKKFKDNTTQKLARTVAASFPNGVPRRKAHPVRAVVPSDQLHTLVNTGRTLQSAQAKTEAQVVLAVGDADSEAAAIMKCVTDKQELTDKIIEARKAARVARTGRMSAEARAAAMKAFRIIVKDQKKVLSSAEQDAEKGFQPLRDLLAAKSVEGDVGDAETEMTGIEKDVEAYIKAGGPPASAGLPTALKGITDTLGQVKSRLLNDMKALESVYTGALMISYPALINQLTEKDEALKKETSVMIDALMNEGDAAAKFEQAEKDLMIQRSGVEYRCLTEGTCGNLHYQQCCSGSGTFMKQVMSWKECAAHCEEIVKSGKQVAGCEMTGLFKEDDRSGSGTCFAQTACTLKPSKDQCAGSLCKPLPAKK